MSTEIQENSFDSVIEKSLKKFNVTDSFFKKMETKFNKLAIIDVNDRAGYSKVKEALAFTRKTKGDIERKRKDLKADIIKYGKAIDGEAKRIQEMLLPINEKLQHKKNQFDAEKDKIKEEKKIAKELIIQNRSIRLIDIGMAFTGVKYIFSDEEITVAELSVYNDKNFDKLIERVIEKVEVVKAEEKRREFIAERLHEREQKIGEYAMFIEDGEDFNFGEWTTDEFNEYLAELVKRSIEFNRLEVEKEKERTRLMKLHEKRMSGIAVYLKYQKEYINTENISDWEEEQYNQILDELKQNKIEFNEEEEKRKEAAEEAKKIAADIAEREIKLAQETLKNEAKIAKDKLELAKAAADLEAKKAEEAAKQLIAAMKPDKTKLKALAKSLKEFKLPVVKSKEAKGILLDVVGRLSEISNYIESTIK